MFPTLARAVGVVRREPAMFVAAAAIVELPVAALAVVTTILIDQDIDPSLTWQYALISLLASSWASFGHHALSALGERIVAAERNGVDVRFDHVVSGFPWRRVIVADVVVTIAIAVGILLLVVPGLALMVWTAPLFPLLNMERQPIVATARRSFALVRGHFWRLALLLAVTRLLAQAIGFVGAGVFDALGSSDVVEVLVHSAVEAVLAPIIAVVAVIAAFDLRAMFDRRQEPEPA